MLALLLAVTLTIPSIGLQTQADPRQEPANLIFEGSFDGLEQVAVYDTLTLTDDLGASQDFVVAWSRAYPAGGLPPEVTDGPASGGQVVTVITDEPSSDVGYPQQRVVRAAPLS
ncbi:MAG: hypothetical protein NVS4B6_19150 [Mycobacterium sp.]